MRPTLFADHVPDDFRTDSEWLMNMREALRVLKPILPRRCRIGNDVQGYNDCSGSVFVIEFIDSDPTPGPHPECEGRGWLYPDPPDWWPWDKAEAPKRWEGHCDAMWRAMGILEDV